MLFTLHRYIFRELFKVFLLAAVGLTLILSLGSILQPVQEFGLGSRQVVSLMGYFLPITLTFVLPMAALFAGALVYGRFASDNEFDTCRATGISVLTLVYPGLALAIIVATANLILSFYVMPVFVHRAEESLKADAKQILFRNIQRRRYYALPPEKKYLIYADQADMASGTLSGVIVAQMKGSSAIEDFTTTEIAKIDFDPHERFNVVRIFAYKPRMMGAEVEGGADWVPFTYEFGSLLGDDIKFKKIDEMKRIQADPIRFYPIEKLATDTYKQLKIELLAQDIKRRLAPFGERGDTSLGDGENGRNSYDLLREPNSVRFTADQCDVRDSHIELSGKVLVTEYETDSRRPLRTLECTGVSLHLEGDELTSTLTMDIQNAEDAASAIVIMWPSFRGLILPQPVQDMANQVMTGNGSLKTEELTRELSGLLGSQPSEKLTSLQERLRRDMLKTLVEIKAEIHSRLVFGTGCVPMILIGMGLGIIRKGGHLLTAFGASCIPAAVLIVCIMSGKQLTKNLGAAQAVSGETVMWAGLGFLSLLVVIIYGRLLRH
ncbi:MAG: LptF/LptG family permease [Planctomycetota bacterium]|jgi:lipopolysaccharide export LptBFGC system permease protein LptF